MVCFAHKGSTQPAKAKMLLILMWLFVLADPLTSDEVSSTSQASSSTQVLITSTSSTEVRTSRAVLESASTTDPLTSNLTKSSTSTNPIDERHSSTGEVFKPKSSTTESFISSPSSSEIPTPLTVLNSASKTSKNPTVEMPLTTGKGLTSAPSLTQISTMNSLSTSESSATNSKLSTSILMEVTASEETHLSTEHIFTPEPSTTTKSFVSSPGSSEVPILLGSSFSQSTFSASETEPETSIIDILSISKSLFKDSKLSTSILVELTTSEDTHLSTEEVFTSEPSTTESFISSPSPSEFPTSLDDLDSESTFSSNPTEPETSTMDILSASMSSATDFEVSTSILMEPTASDEIQLYTEEAFTSEPSTTESFISSPSPSAFPTSLNDLDSESTFSLNPTEPESASMDILLTSESSATDFEVSTSILMEPTASDEIQLYTEEAFTSEPSTTELFTPPQSPSEFPTESTTSVNPTETETFTMEISPTEHSAADAEPSASSPSSSEVPTDTFTSDVGESVTSITYSTTAAVTRATTETPAATTAIKTSVSACPKTALNKQAIRFLSVLLPLLLGHWN